MDLLFNILLVIHITGGSIGLITGAINLYRKKGDRKHRSIGKVFTYSMLTTGFTALALAIIHPSFFLFIVGSFTVYLIGTGSRYIYLKLLDKDQRPGYLDWTLTIMMLLTGSVFLVLGLKQLFQEHYFGIVMIVFGLFSLFLVRTDFINYSAKSRFKNYWLLAHIARMTGGYIAAFTAFLVVNSTNLPLQVPGFVLWILPTAIFTPLIFKWSSHYQVKK